ncbi:hypothetical protein ACHHYP_17103 [Achlya hypogyna]|uniref:C2 domain-containing protein n=1 Tax=Achlya hypogyna TaxID=1202772 RepID=A0A1V9Y577_ACHHY|nr:hypothetical protein ACHHYP_17103 [Achlya hypogyna]
MYMKVAPESTLGAMKEDEPQCTDEEVDDMAHGDNADVAPYFSVFSADFFEQLDALVDTHFGTALWQDIIKTQQPLRRRKSVWEPSDGWTMVPVKAQLTTLDSVYLDESPEDPNVPEPDIPEPEDNQATHEVHAAAETHLLTPEAPMGLDAMLRIARLARTIQRAAQKFKRLLHRKERPMQLQIHRAANLRSADWNGYSDPYVIVTAFEQRGVQTRYEAANYALTKTEIQYKTLNPVWDFTVILPHMTRDTLLCLTVVDYDFGSSPDFLGQAVLSLDQFHGTMDLELPLGPLVHTPLHADRTPMSFGDRDVPGQGTLSVTLGVVPCLVSGVLQVKPPAPLLRSSWFGSNPTYQLHYGYLHTVNNELVLYSTKDRAACTPTYSIPLDTISRILDRDDDEKWELHSLERHELPPWIFRIDYSTDDRSREHTRWVKALGRATRRPILIETAPSQYQFKFIG